MAEWSLPDIPASCSPLLFWSSAPDARRRRFAPMWAHFAGCAESDLQDEAWLARVHKADREQLEDALRAAASSEDALQLEYRFRRFDGRFRRLLEVARPEVDDAGDVIGYTGACVDVTDRPVPLNHHVDHVEHVERAESDAIRELDERNRVLVTKLESSLDMVRRLRAATDRASGALQQTCDENRRLRERLQRLESGASRIHARNGAAAEIRPDLSGGGGDGGGSGSDDVPPADHERAHAISEDSVALDLTCAATDRESVSAGLPCAPHDDEHEARRLKRLLIERSVRERNVNRIASDLLESRLIRPLFDILEGRVPWQSEILDEEAASELERCRSAIRFLKTQLSNILDLSGRGLPAEPTDHEHENVFNLVEVLHRSMMHASDFAERDTGAHEAGPPLDHELPDLVRGDEGRFRLALFYTLSQAMAFSASTDLCAETTFEGEVGKPGIFALTLAGRAWVVQPAAVEAPVNDAEPGVPHGPHEVESACNRPTQIASRFRLAQTLCELFQGRLEVELHDDGRFETRFEFPLTRLENSEGNHRRHVRMHIESLNCNLGRVVNLSRGGACLECNRVPPTETVIEFDSQVGDDEPLTVPAHVVWSRRSGLRSYEVGLRFLNDSEDTARRLSELAALHGKRRMIETASD